jgi:hypothetical protein
MHKDKFIVDRSKMKDGDKFRIGDKYFEDIVFELGQSLTHE